MRGVACGHTCRDASSGTAAMKRCTTMPTRTGFTVCWHGRVSSASGLLRQFQPVAKTPDGAVPRRAAPACRAGARHTPPTALGVISLSQPIKACKSLSLLAGLGAWMSRYSSTVHSARPGSMRAPPRPRGRRHGGLPVSSSSGLKLAPPWWRPGESAAAARQACKQFGQLGGLDHVVVGPRLQPPALGHAGASRAVRMSTGMLRLGMSGRRNDGSTAHPCPAGRCR